MISHENNAAPEMFQHLRSHAEEILAKETTDGTDKCALTDKVRSTPEIIPANNTAFAAGSLHALTAPVSFFENITNTAQGEEYPLRNILDRIVTGEWRHQVESYRSLPQGDETEKARKKAAKRAMPNFTTAGTFLHRNKRGLLELSGYAILDFDNVPELADTKTRLATLPFVMAVFVSLGGDGLKAIIRNPAWVKNTEDFELFIGAAMEHISMIVGVPADPSGKDVCRSCFVSYDPELYLNPTPAPFPLKREESINGRGVRKEQWAPAPSSPKPSSPKPIYAAKPPRRTRATRHDIEVALALLPHLGHDEWVKVIAAVHDAACRGVISHDEVEPLLRRYHPEVEEGEYRHKIHHRLDQVHLETLFYLVNRHAGVRLMSKGGRHA